MAGAGFDGAVVTFNSNQSKQMPFANTIYPAIRVYLSSAFIVNNFFLSGALIENFAVT